MGELLAKPEVSLVNHIAEVLRLGDAIARDLRLDENLRVKALVACALHDIGKATLDFQEYIRGKRGRAYPHALASLPFILIAEIRLGQKYGWDQQSLSATAAVLTHHSPLGPQLYKGYEPPQYHPDLPQALNAIWTLLSQSNVRGLTADTLLSHVQPLLKASPAALLDETYLFNGSKRSLRGIFQHLPVQEFAQVKTVLHLADWLASANQHNPRIIFLENGKKAIVAHIDKLKVPLRDFQQRVQQAKSKVLWLRAPTGTGKTEALLLWAGDAERIIYLLPTQATVNAMWRRLRRIYGHERVALAHGRSSYVLRRETSLDEDPLDLRLFGSIFAKPITVATLDQYLLAHLNGRHWEERRSLAQRATIILDEIHAYEPYTLGLLLRALDQEKPSRLALASATLPTPLLELFPQGELVEAENELWQRTRHRLKLQEGLLRDGLENAVAWAHEGKKVLIVANTVEGAQELYRTLRDQLNWQRCKLLHSRFIFRDRQEKEAQVERPEPGTILIATQVVEVSLDISYDVLLTEVAPIDALVQRMGRVNRRGEDPPASVIVYRQWSEGSQRIYGKEMLTWSLEILESLPLEPTDRDLADATYRLYKLAMTDPAWHKELQEGSQTLEEVQRVLGCYTIDLSDEELRARFTARHSMISVEVLPEQFLQEAYELKERNETWRLPELLVQVPIYWLKQAEFFTPIRDLHCIQTTLAYNSEEGLKTPKSKQTVTGYALVD